MSFESWYLESTKEIQEHYKKEEKGGTFTISDATGEEVAVGDTATDVTLSDISFEDDWELVDKSPEIVSMSEYNHRFEEWLNG